MKHGYRNLGEFIQVLGRAGEIRTVRQPVSHHLEISRMTDFESKSPQGGKALFFEKVIGSPFPAATNLFGSPRRICMALGVGHLDELGNRIRELLDQRPPEGLRDMIALIPTALNVANYFPRRSRRKTPPCQEIVHTSRDVDLGRLPVLHCWPKDAGPFVTLPLVFTRSPETGRRNVGMYRLQIFDRNTTGMHWHIHKDGSHYYGEYCRRGQRMPVAVAIGADPATIYAATAPMPRNIDEMILAGFIRNRPVPMARCCTIDMEVPAEAEFVLEGYVDPGELRREGPFGDHTGYYSLADDYPVFHVTAITHRRNPVYCATLVGPPPMEDCYLAKATERLFLPLIQTVFPEIRNYWLPWEGVFHNIVVVAVDKAFAGHAQKVMHGLWGQGQMSFCKAIVVVDADIDPTRPSEIFKALLTLFDPATDLTLTRGVLDVLDHSSPLPTFGNKIGIDLTRRVAAEPPRTEARQSAEEPVRPEKIIAALKQAAPGIRAVRLYPADGEHQAGYGSIAMLNVERNQEQTGRWYAYRLLAAGRPGDPVAIVLYDTDIDLNNDSLLLWKLFNNVDPGRDCHIQNQRMVIDACIKGPADGHKREWPEALTFDPV